MSPELKTEPVSAAKDDVKPLAQESFPRRERMRPTSVYDVTREDLVQLPASVKGQLILEAARLAPDKKEEVEQTAAALELGLIDSSMASRKLWKAGIGFGSQAEIIHEGLRTTHPRDPREKELAWARVLARLAPQALVKAVREGRASRDVAEEAVKLEGVEISFPVA